MCLRGAVVNVERHCTAARLTRISTIDPKVRADAEKRFLEHLSTIERIAAFYCRRARMTDADTEDFVGFVKLELIENDYEIIRTFEGRSSFATWLTTVIHRMLHQYRTKAWGKWRPSAEAKRMGDVAIALERLTTRDGYSASEAIELLTTGSTPAASRRELEAMLLRLPVRTPRPMLVPDDNVPDVAAEDDPSDSVMSRDRETCARRTAAALDEALAEFEPEDRLILKRRFWSAQRIADIADSLHLDAKKTYKRIDRLLASLRSALELRGITADDLADLFAHDEAIEIGSDAEIESSRPSKQAAGKFGTGKRRTGRR